MSTYGDDPTQPANDPAPDSVSFGPPSQEDPFAGATVLPAQAPPARNKRRTVLVAAVAGVLVVGGGAAVWAAASYLSGGGDQPASVVPSSAIAYANVDFDPSAGQKLAAYQFLRKFPSADKTSGEGDLMGQVVKSVLRSDSSASADYARDIEPWLGKRAAVAAVPVGGGKEPQALFVVQVTDEGKAKASIRKLLDEAAAAETEESGFALGTTEDGIPFSSTSSADAVPTGLVVRDGYALIGQDQKATEAMSQAAEQSDLAGSSQYSADMDEFGQNGVASAWIDVDAATSTLDAATKASYGLGVGNVTGGRVVAVVRFDGDTVELDAKQFGAKPSAPTTGANGGAILAKLPADTTGAVAVGHASEVLTKLYEQIEAEAAKSGNSLADIGSGVGITLPADLQKLVGSGFALSVGDVSDDDAEIAVRVVTTDPSGSKAVVEKARAAVASEGQGLVTVPEFPSALSDDGVVYALTPAYAQLVAGAGTLGEQADFKAALPDAASAQHAAYLNFGRVAAQIDDAEVSKELAVLRSLGVTTTSSGTESQVTVRLVAR